MKKSVMSGSLPRILEKSWRLVAVALMTSLLFSACSLLPHSLRSPPPDQTLFLQGLDALSATSTPEAFSRLVEEYPESPWADRVKVIKKIQGQLLEAQGERRQLAELQGELQQELNQLQKKFDECRAERERLAGDLRYRDEKLKEFEACRVERERLVKDVRSLERYTLKLKSLLAESGIVEPAPPTR